MPDLVPIRRALVSVSDKAELIPFIKVLVDHGVEIISTGGTATAIKAAGLRVTSIDAVTGFPEIMGGRVKTLHPKVHGGLLGLRDDPAHAAQMREHHIEPIDLVCVNLYPFEKTVANPTCTEHDAIENIDIGGPSMLRSAAKNFEYVTVVTAPAQYARVIEELSTQRGSTTRALRADFARAVFATTSRYDAAIAAYLSQSTTELFPPLMSLGFVRLDELRYGENPHQRAALYRKLAASTSPKSGVAGAEQLHGKELSYNNLVDASAAYELVASLKRVDPSAVGAAVIKHTNPCGAALVPENVEIAGSSPVAFAIDQAIAGDPIAAYGGILALNDVLDEAGAQRLLDKEVFLEVIIAAGFEPEALELLRKKSANVRLLNAGEFPETSAAEMEFRTIPGGMLMQEKDARLLAASELQHHAGPQPTPEHIRAAAFLEAVCRALFSNAIVIGGRADGKAGAIIPGAVRMYGAGAGQMDRVTSCRLATEKAGAKAKGATAFSDAFFPFDDGPKILADAGVACIVHPGGSKRDDETFTLCNARGVTCLTTGIRHFRH
jgi:phosphoribosylaminoimidazolecarboxamide formyltransferase / IMP cyclohydrolase